MLQGSHLELLQQRSQTGSWFKTVKTKLNSVLVEKLCYLFRQVAGLCKTW